jgi:YHS domain-containing protein
MDVDPATAKISRTYGGTTVIFCGNHCAEKFDENPTQYCQPSADCKDPVCGMSVDPATAKVSRTYSGTTVFFCGNHCGDKFDQDPERYLKTESSHA